MNIDNLLVIFTGILLIISIFGAILPIIPGSILAWLAILILKFTSYGNLFSWYWVLFFTILLIINKVIDYLIPIWGVKKYGGTKYGIYGSLLGTIIGLFFPPLGFIIFPFIGAFLGEYFIAKLSNKTSLKASFGNIIGMILGIFINIIFIIFHFIFYIYIIFFLKN